MNIGARYNKQRVAPSYTLSTAPNGDHVITETATGATLKRGAELGSGSYGLVSVYTRLTDGAKFSVKMMHREIPYDFLFDSSGAIRDISEFPEDFIIAQRLSRCDERARIVHAQNVAGVMVEFASGRKEVVGGGSMPWRVPGRRPVAADRREPVHMYSFQVMEGCVGDIGRPKHYATYESQTTKRMRLDDYYALIEAATEAAQCARLLYTDVKPANLLLCPDGGRLVPSLGDFGSFAVIGSEGITTYNVPWDFPHDSDYEARSQLRTVEDACKLGVFTSFVLYDSVMGGGRDLRSLDHYANYMKGMFEGILEEASSIDRDDILRDPAERYIDGLNKILLMMTADADEAEDAAMTDVSEVSPTPWRRTRVPETPASDARRPVSGPRPMSVERRWWDGVPSLM